MDRYNTETRLLSDVTPADAGLIASAMDTQAGTSHSPWLRSDELLSRNVTAVPMLVEGLFVAKGLAGIVGASDTGKSMFARQLAIDVAIGASHFMDYPLNSIHKSAIYVASEDSQDATAFLLKKQWRGLSNDRLRCLFAEECDDRLSVLVAEALSTEGADLVVIDTWGDLFAFDAEKNANNNNEIAVRRLLAEYSRMAQEFGCLILFVHHTRKGGSKETPHRDHTSGSGAFERKLRCLIHMTVMPGRAVEGCCPELTGEDLRAVTVTKANYLERDRKENITILRWIKNEFRFEDTGRTANLDIFGQYLSDEAPKAAKGKEPALPKLEAERDYSRSELAALSGSSGGTFNRALQIWLSAGQLVKSAKRGCYKLPKSVEDVPE